MQSTTESTIESTQPQITDWPDAYVMALRNDEFWEAGDHAILAELCQNHMKMRWGHSIDLNVQQGFYFHPGNGQVTLEQGTDVGYVIAVLDSVCDTIDLMVDGSVAYCRSEYEHHYVDDGVRKMEWVFREAKGPWLLTTESVEQKWTTLDLLVVRFLDVADDAAFMAAFPETDA